MNMTVRPGVSSEDVKLFCTRASRLVLSQIIDNVTVKERLKVEGETRRTEFSVKLSFFPQEEYEAEYDVEPSEIMGCFASKFPLLLKKEMQLEMKRLDADLKSQIAELGKGKKERGGAADAADDEEADEAEPKPKRGQDEESEAGDGDADDEKRSRQKKQMATYSDDEDEGEGGDEYNEAAIQAAYASDDGEAVEDEALSSKKRANLASRVVADLFIRNLHLATTFNFTPSECNFELQVKHSFLC